MKILPSAEMLLRSILACVGAYIAYWPLNALDEHHVLNRALLLVVVSLAGLAFYEFLWKRLPAELRRYITLPITILGLLCVGLYVLVRFGAPVFLKGIKIFLDEARARRLKKSQATQLEKTAPSSL